MCDKLTIAKRHSNSLLIVLYAFTYTLYGNSEHFGYKYLGIK
jgi:hypothetical protein